MLCGRQTSLEGLCDVRLSLWTDAFPSQHGLPINPCHTLHTLTKVRAVNTDRFSIRQNPHILPMALLVCATKQAERALAIIR
jgi:hypothetical protein